MRSSQIRRFLVYSVSVGAIVGWIVFSEWMLARVVEDAYAWRSHPVVNSLIHGRDRFTVEDYQVKARRRANLVLAVLVGMAAVAVAIESPWLNHWLHRVAPCDVDVSTPRMRGSTRQILAVALIAALPSLQAAAAVVQFDAWPFSGYAMFNGVRANTFRREAMFGVSSEGEFPLASVADAFPYNLAVQEMGLVRRLNHPDGRASITSILAVMRNDYEARRTAGLHAGPPIRAIRFRTLRFRFELSNPYEVEELESTLIASSEDHAES